MTTLTDRDAINQVRVFLRHNSTRPYLWCFSKDIGFDDAKDLFLNSELATQLKSQIEEVFSINLQEPVGERGSFVARLEESRLLQNLGSASRL